jgi:hypothetical protein
MPTLYSGKGFLLTCHPAPIESEKPLCWNNPLILIENTKVLAELRDSHHNIPCEAVIAPENTGKEAKGAWLPQDQPIVSHKSSKS